MASAAENEAVLDLIELANERRRRPGGTPGSATDDVRTADAEAKLEDRYRHSERLAVYGTLAPGRSNHRVVASYGGTWTRGRVRGDLVEAGWGAAAGYPALRCRADGPWVAVEVLESGLLPGAWPAIDDFEGSEYQRVLVPVYPDSGEGISLITVANLYEARSRGQSC